MMYRDVIIFIQGTLWNWTIPEVSKRQKIQKLLFKRTPAQLDCLHLGHSTTRHRSVSTAFWDTVPIRSYPHREDNKVPSSKRIKTQHVSVIPFPSTLARCMAHASSAKPFSSMFRAFGRGAKFEVDYWRVPRCSKSQALFNPISSYFNNQIGSWVTYGFIRVSSK